MAILTGQSARRGNARDIAAGLLLLVIAAGSYAGALDLSFRDGVSVGPGLMPKGVALLIAAFGVLILVTGLLAPGAALERWSIRGPLFVLGAVVVFAATVRTFGLAFAGPLAVIISALGDEESKILEVLVFALVMSALCIGLFKYALRLPIPLAPLLLGY